MFAIASAYAAGNFIGGASADALGFGSLTWVVGVVSVIALVLGFLCFRYPGVSDAAEDDETDAA